MFEAIGKATGLIKTVIKLKDEAEILEAIIPLQDAINDAQREATEAISKIHTLTVENIDLKKQLCSQEDLQTWRSKYELQNTGVGTQILKLKEKHDRSLDYEYICPHCYEEGVRSPMNVLGIQISCHRCKNTITIIRPNIPVSGRKNHKLR